MRKKEKTKDIISPYIPRPLQQVVHDTRGRFTVIAAHRRWGKSKMCIEEVNREAWRNPRERPQYAYLGPERTQVKMVVWDEWKQHLRNVPGINFNESELRIDFPDRMMGGKIVQGARIYLRGADNPDSLRGIYLDGVIMDEVAQMPKSVWTQVIRPALSDRLGWAMFIGTPKGKNFFYDLYVQADTGKNKKGMPVNGWKAFMFKASETGYVGADELEDAKNDMSPEEYDQEYECSFDAALQGTYYGKTMEHLRAEGGVGTYTYNPKYPVITSWDLGINDLTVIWFAQQYDGITYIIDYYEDSNKAIPHYVNVIKAKPYIYDYHIMPHDVNKRSFSTGVTRVEEFIRADLKVRVAPKLPIFDGINAVRSILPLCRFNESRCEKGLIALFHYRSALNEKLGVQQQVPIHDKYSHAADAFRYLAITLRPKKGVLGEDHTNPKLKLTQYNSEYDIFQL